MTESEEQAPAEDVISAEETAGEVTASEAAEETASEVTAAADEATASEAAEETVSEKGTE